MNKLKCQPSIFKKYKKYNEIHLKFYFNYDYSFSFSLIKGKHLLIMKAYSIIYLLVPNADIFNIYKIMKYTPLCKV